MASLSVNVVGVFPASTVVTAYPYSDRTPNNAAPPGASEGSGTVTSAGVLAISGLDYDTSYWLAASVSSTWRWMKVRTAPLGTSSEGFDERSEGNLGSAYTLAMDGENAILLKGTLNADCTITVTDSVSPAQIVLLVTQDGTGGRTLTVAHESGGSVSPAVSSAAGDRSKVELWLTDETDLTVVA